MVNPIICTSETRRPGANQNLAICKRLTEGAQRLKSPRTPLHMRITCPSSNNRMCMPYSARTPPIFDLQMEVADTLRNFYHFLTKLPWLHPDDILEPPEQGWPNINIDNFGPFQKSGAVIELLKHLPYIRMDGPNREYKLAWSTYPCDYRRDYFQEVRPGIDCWEMPATTERNFTFPEWVIPLTYGKVHGQYIMLDTTDGIHTPYSILTVLFLN
jgi:hypothetical protein